MESEWRPTGKSIRLPNDAAAVWQRLSALALLGWPTPAEMTERAILSGWLNPATGGTVHDTHVFQAAAHVMSISARSDAEFLVPVFAAAGEAWVNLQKLATGVAVVDPRANPDAQETRRAMANAWFTQVMRQLEVLDLADVVFSFDLPAMTAHSLRYSLRHEFMSEAFDGAYAIGASMFLEPSLPGSHFGNSDQVIYVADALAVAVQDAIKALNAAVGSGEIGRVRARLGFLWMMLKGFVYAGAASNRGVLLPDVYLRNEPMWAEVRKSLIGGRDALAASSASDVKPVTWVLPGTALGSKVADTSVEVIIAAMEQSIERARARRDRYSSR